MAYSPEANLNLIPPQAVGHPSSSQIFYIHTLIKSRALHISNLSYNLLDEQLMLGMMSWYSLSPDSER